MCGRPGLVVRLQSFLYVAADSDVLALRVGVAAQDVDEPPADACMLNAGGISRASGNPQEFDATMLFETPRYAAGAPRIDLAECRN